jgi:deazaflavin-dependent oxidoreductase (nitroreductase family)
MQQKGFPGWIGWIARHRWGRWLSKNLYTPVDKLVYRVTKGRRGLSPARAVLLLTTTGRKTGHPRQVPILYLRDGERFWVMASNYGQAHHPAWSSNLLATPEAHVTIGTYSSRVRARLASDEEKRAKWPDLLALYPAWSAYTDWTDRNFRLFCLEPEGTGVP